MKKPQKDKIPPKGVSPFGRFEQVAQKIVTVPKQKTKRNNKSSSTTLPIDLSLGK